MNIQRVVKCSIATVAGLGALGLVALDSARNNEKSMQQNKTEQILEPTDSIDVSKPNLPLIGKDFIQYRGLDGKVNKVVNTNETASVYRAIAKMSSPKEPDIVAPEDFYTEVQKNINSFDDSNVYIDKSIDKQIYKMRMTDLFDKAFKMATAFESEEGSVITVREYTRLMDIFSKTSSNNNEKY